jgi:hypothetical protein
MGSIRVCMFTAALADSQYVNPCQQLKIAMPTAISALGRSALSLEARPGLPNGPGFGNKLLPETEGISGGM